MSQYDDFAVNYHWLYSDYVSSGKPALEENEDVLKDAGPTVRILDCSCGIGTLAIALAKLGYEVSGSDGSLGYDRASGCCRQERRCRRPAEVLYVGGSTGSRYRSLRSGFLSWQRNRAHPQRRRNVSVGAGNARGSKEWRQTRHSISQLGADPEEKRRFTHFHVESARWATVFAHLRLELSGEVRGRSHDRSALNLRF